MIEVSLSLAFGAGFLSFLSPCVLPLIPFFLSYVSGASVADLKAASINDRKGLSWKARLRVMRGAFGFVAGFSVVTVLILGSLAGAFAQWMTDYSRAISSVAGIFVIVLGLHLARLINIPFLRQEKRLEIGRTAGGSASFMSSMLVGFSFGAGWSPCIGPIVGGVIALAGTSGHFSQGILMMVAYTAGLAVPFLLSAALVTHFFTTFDRFKRYLTTVEIVSGVLLIVIGVLIATGSLSDLNTLLIKTFPAFSNLV